MCARQALVLLLALAYVGAVLLAPFHVVGAWMTASHVALVTPARKVLTAVGRYRSRVLSANGHLLMLYQMRNANATKGLEVRA